MATKQNAKEYPIQIIREDLRRRSTQEAALLARSVGRLTSCDVQPCLEYRDEITNEHAVIDRLLYVQECRNSLERCIGSGAARLRYRWRDGRVTETRFRRSSPGRVRVSGLLAEPALRAAERRIVETAMAGCGLGEWPHKNQAHTVPPRKI